MVHLKVRTADFSATPLVSGNNCHTRKSVMLLDTFLKAAPANILEELLTINANQ
jgi:hypothetical protein